MFLTLLQSLLLQSVVMADVSSCERIQAEAAELGKGKPLACSESRETHETYLKSFTEIQEICKNLSNQARGGNSEGESASYQELFARFMELKQKHMLERQEIYDRLNNQLLPTALDKNEPSQQPAKVSSDCGAEMENYLRYRRLVMNAFADFFAKIEKNDESLFIRAQQLPASSGTSGPQQKSR